jgi:5-methylcytosine-specific restriction endonuclease McrA
MKIFGCHLPATRDYDAEIRELQAQIDALRNELAEKDAALAQKDAQLQAAWLQRPAAEPERFPAPEPLPVRDLSPKLTIELVPQTGWLSNVRSHVTNPEWDVIRKRVYQAAGYRCDVCGGKGIKHPVECHEIFSFEDQTRLQKLVRMVALCPSCHRVKHFGFARTQGLEEQAYTHLCRVNGWTREVAERYVDQQFRVWQERSRHEWSAT